MGQWRNGIRISLKSLGPKGIESSNLSCPTLKIRLSYPAPKMNLESYILNDTEFIEHQWLYWNDVERCPYATFSTKYPEERAKGFEWGRQKDIRNEQLAFMRFLDWDRLVTGYN